MNFASWMWCMGPLHREWLFIINWGFLSFHIQPQVLMQSESEKYNLKESITWHLPKLFTNRPMIALGYPFLFLPHWSAHSELWLAIWTGGIGIMSWNSSSSTKRRPELSTLSMSSLLLLGLQKPLIHSFTPVPLWSKWLLLRRSDHSK